MKGIIIYDTKYGSTEQYAFWISDEFELPIARYENVTSEELRDTDIVIIGSPIYIGKLGIKKWLHKNLVELHTKRLIFFIVGGTDPDEIAKIEEIITENIPGDLRQNNNIFYLHGRMMTRKLSFTDKLLLNMGARLNREKGAKEKMLRDFDDVKKSNLAFLFESIKAQLHDEALEDPDNSKEVFY